jgi:hypothetical protein
VSTKDLWLGSHFLANGRPNINYIRQPTSPEIEAVASAKQLLTFAVTGSPHAELLRKYTAIANHLNRNLTGPRTLRVMKWHGFALRFSASLRLVGNSRRPG